MLKVKQMSKWCIGSGPVKAGPSKNQGAPVRSGLQTATFVGSAFRVAPVEVLQL